MRRDTNNIDNSDEKKTSWKLTLAEPTVYAKKEPATSAPVGREWSRTDRTDRTVNGSGGGGLDTFWEMIRFVGRVSKAACDVISTHGRRTQVGRLCSMAGNPSKRSPPPPSPKKCPLPSLPSYATQSFFPRDPPPFHFPSRRGASPGASYSVFAVYTTDKRLGRRDPVRGLMWCKESDLDPVHT